MKSRFLAAVFAVVLTAGTLTGCGSAKTSEPTKTETAKEETSSDKEVTQEPVSEEEAAADGFTDGSDGESAKLDTSEELTGIHHAGIDIKDYGSIEIELDADTAPITVTNFVKLAQDGFYDGLTFWRIIDGFMTVSYTHLTLPTKA